jgi:hypothetical protein
MLLKAMPARRVRQLRLRTSSEDDVPSVAGNIADALHTASLPLAEGGALIAIRRLSLGRLLVRDSRTAIALRIEAAAREASAAAVRFDDPRAPSANAVQFPDAAHALIALARCHARRIDADAWFWSAVVPGWPEFRTRPDRWIALLEAVHRQPGSALVSAAVVAEALQAATSGELLAAVDVSAAARWLRVEGWVLSPAILSAPPGRLVLSAAVRAVVEHWLLVWGSCDERLIWLAILLAIRDQPGRAIDPRFAQKVANWLASILPHPGRPVPNQPCTPRFALAQARRAVQSAESVQPAGEPAAPAAAPAARPSELAPAEPVLPGEATSTEHEGVPPAIDRFTWGGGLFFLVPVLERLGFDTYLRSRLELMESGFAWRLLAVFAGRAGVESDDPLLLEISNLACPAGLSETAHWVLEARRWCRRQARIGLVNLIRRHAQFSGTRTHVDVHFGLSQLDTRIRRAGLDIDPGWVPWLGRVIQFHYIEPHEPVGQ